MGKPKSGRFYAIFIGIIWAIALLAWPLIVIVGSLLGYESGVVILFTGEPFGYNDVGLFVYVCLMPLAFLGTIIIVALRHLKSKRDNSIIYHTVWIIIWFLIAGVGATLVYFCSILLGLLVLFTIFEPLGAAFS